MCWPLNYGCWAAIHTPTCKNEMQVGEIIGLCSARLTREMKELKQKMTQVAHSTHYCSLSIFSLPWGSFFLGHPWVTGLQKRQTQSLWSKALVPTHSKQRRALR